MKDLHSTPFPSRHASQCDSCIFQQHSLRSPDFSQALVGDQKGYQTYRDLPWDLQKIRQPAIKIRHLEPWKIALIVIGTAVAAAVTIGLLVYFLAYDQKLFYYSGNLKITNIRYNNELSRQSSGRFRDLSERVERVDLGLSTVWDDQLSYLLSPALAAYELERTTSVSAGNEEFQDAVRRAVPDGHTFKGFPIHFVYRNARRSFATCLRSPFCEEIICCRGDQVRLAVRVRVFTYPESACAVWIMFACKYRSVL